MTDAIPRVAPDRTVVFAVGIEKYEYGAEMDLPGAADYAVRFARWARKCDVPADRIWLGCSWLQPPVEPSVPGAHDVSTKRDDLDTALHKVAAADADLLLFYWCGHGLLDEKRRRVLFTSNALSGRKAHLPVDEIIQLLSSTTGAALNRQILLVDACANYLKDMGFATGLARFELEKGDPRSVDQYVIYSAEQGRIAEYDRLKRTAAFSTAALAWLEDPDPSRRILPPTMTALATHVTEALQRSAAPGEVPRLPVTFQIKPYHGEGDWTGEVLPINGTAHATAMERGLTVPQIRRLVRAVMDSPLLTDGEQTRRFAAAIDALPLPNTAGGMEQAVTLAILGGRVEALVAALEDLGAGDPDSATDVRRCWERQCWIAELVRLPWQAVTLSGLRRAYSLAVPKDTQRVVSDVDTAFDDAAARGIPGDPDAPLYMLVAMLEHHADTRVADAWFELDAQQLVALRARARQRFDEGASPARLVVDLRGTRSRHGGGPWPDVVSWQLFHVGEWSTREETGCAATCEGVRQAVQTAVDWARGRTSGFAIGLVVPRVLQDAVPEAWPMGQPIYDPEPLGALYPVVLHSGERFSLKPEAIRKTWQDRLERVRARLRERTDVGWVPASNPPNLRAMRLAVQDSPSAVIGLEFAPGPAPPELKDDPVVATIACGAPYVVWLDQEPDAWETAKNAVEQLVALGAFEELPHRLFELRRQDPETIRAGPRLLWDDDALPPVEQLRGTQTLSAAVGKSPASAWEGP
jgi:hypothetical protein